LKCHPTENSEVVWNPFKITIGDWNSKDVLYMNENQNIDKKST